MIVNSVCNAIQSDLFVLFCQRMIIIATVTMLQLCVGQQMERSRHIQVTWLCRLTTPLCLHVPRRVKYKSAGTSSPLDQRYYHRPLHHCVTSTTHTSPSITHKAQLVVVTWLLTAHSSRTLAVTCARIYKTQSSRQLSLLCWVILSLRFHMSIWSFDYIWFDLANCHKSCIQ